MDLPHPYLLLALYLLAISGYSLRMSHQTSPFQLYADNLPQSNHNYFFRSIDEQTYYKAQQIYRQNNLDVQSCPPATPYVDQSAGNHSCFACDPINNQTDLEKDKILFDVQERKCVVCQKGISQVCDRLANGTYWDHLQQIKNRPQGNYKAGVYSAGSSNSGKQQNGNKEGGNGKSDQKENGKTTSGSSGLSAGAALSASSTGSNNQTNEGNESSKEGSASRVGASSKQNLTQGDPDSNKPDSSKTEESDSEGSGTVPLSTNLSSKSNSSSSGSVGATSVSKTSNTSEQNDDSSQQNKSSTAGQNKIKSTSSVNQQEFVVRVGSDQQIPSNSTTTTTTTTIATLIAKPNNTNSNSSDNATNSSNNNTSVSKGYFATVDNNKEQKIRQTNSNETGKNNETEAANKTGSGVYFATASNKNTPDNTSNRTNKGSNSTSPSQIRNQTQLPPDNSTDNNKTNATNENNNTKITNGTKNATTAAVVTTTQTTKNNTNNETKNTNDTNNAKNDTNDTKNKTNTTNNTTNSSTDSKVKAAVVASATQNNCPQSRPLFNTQTKLCQTCPSNLQFSPTKQKCLPVIYATSPQAPNLILTNLTELTQINQRKQLQHPEQVLKYCPMDHPYAQQNKCTVCNYEHQYFYVTTHNCVTGCPPGTYYDKRVFKCVSAIHYTDVNAPRLVSAVGDFQEWKDRVKFQSTVSPRMTQCPEYKPYEIDGDCVSCDGRLFDIDNSRCTDCGKGRQYNATLRKCVGVVNYDDSMKTFAAGVI